MNLKNAKIWAIAVAMMMLITAACSPMATDSDDTGLDDNVVDEMATEISDGVGGIPEDSATDAITDTGDLQIEATETASAYPPATGANGGLTDDDLADLDDADLDDDEEIAIYAAVVRRIIDTDDTFGGTLLKPIVYILTDTDDAAGDPRVGSGDSDTIDSEVRDGITAALSDLSSSIVWIDSRDELSLDENGSITDGGVLVTLGNIYELGDDDDEDVLVGGSIYVGNLAAGGKTYVLEEQNGTWTITGTTGMDWIS